MVPVDPGPFFELTPDPALMLDEDGRVLLVNAAFVGAFGEAERFLDGRLLADLLPPAEATALRDALREPRVAAGGEATLRALGHAARTMEWRVVPGPLGTRFALLRDVTCAREAERRRVVQLDRLGAVARLTTDAIVIADREGRIEWVNGAFTQQTGYPAHEAVGRTPEFLGSPESDPAAMRALDAALIEGHGVRAELMNRCRDGREILVDVDLRPLRDDEGRPAGWIAIRSDVTERRAAEARLERAEREARESREQLLAAVGTLDDGFVLYDRDDRMVVCNERYRELYAASAHAMVPGATFEAILRAGLANGQYLDALGREEAWLAQRLADHQAASRSVEQALPGDRWLRVVERATPDGGRVGLRVDVTALKRQQRATEEALSRAEEASRAKSAFLATMSHEIRTPMNGILGLADLLAETAASPEQARLVADIRESGEGLLVILNDILDASKIEAGRLTLEAIAFEPHELARRAEALHAPVARDKGLALRVAASEGPARLGDPVRIAQILNNLVSNALKFTETGSVRVRLRNPHDGPLVLMVADTGIGMSEDAAAQAFERFAQADDTITRRYGGTGLGLSIVQGLATAMEGRVSVRSAPGRGTRVEVSLPLPPAPAASAGAPSGPTPRSAARADLAGVRVLAADDNRMNRAVLARLLDRLGAASVVTASGAEAVAQAGGGFDLLMLDISMPDMDGVEALRRIRAAEAAAARAPVPALAVTANALEEQVASYLAAGFAGHLAKPVRLAALAEAGRAVLGGPRASGPGAASPRPACGRALAADPPARGEPGRR